MDFSGDQDARRQWRCEFSESVPQSESTTSRSTARVAVARKVLTIIYAMLKRSEPFKRQRPRQKLIAVPGGKKVTDVSGHPRGVMVPA